MDEAAPILVEARAGYRVIMLNRPARLNAFTEAMHVALREALGAAEADRDCRALLITGAGRGFCAGQDLNGRLSAAGETPVLGGALEAYYNPLVRKLRALPIPVMTGTSTAGEAAEASSPGRIPMVIQSAARPSRASRAAIAPRFTASITPAALPPVTRTQPCCAISLPS